MTGLEPLIGVIVGSLIGYGIIAAPRRNLSPPAKGKTFRSECIDNHVRRNGWTYPLTEKQLEELDELYR